MDRGEEIIGLNGAAAVLDVQPETVRRFAEEGRLRSEREETAITSSGCEDVLGLARELGAESAEEEIFEGEVMGDEPSGNSRLPAVPFERYERLLQQGQDYKTRLEERTRQIEEIRQERDAARMEIDRLWSEIERLNLVEFQRELQEKTISTLEEEKTTLAGRARTPPQGTDGPHGREVGPLRRPRPPRSRAERPEEPRLLGPPLRRLKNTNWERIGNDIQGLLKAWATVLAAILAAILLSYSRLYAPGGSAGVPSCSGKVVLDAGHGGPDSGAVKETHVRPHYREGTDPGRRKEAQRPPRMTATRCA